MKLTLNEWLHRWLEAYVKISCKAAGYAQYRQICEKHIIPMLGDYFLEMITTAVLQDFFMQQSKSGNLKTGKGLSPKSIKNMRVVLDVAFQKAVLEGYLKENPVVGTVIQKVHKKSIYPMEEETLQTLENFLYKNGNLQDVGVLLSLYTGCRLGEICGLQWKDVDWRRKEIHIRRTVKRLPAENEKTATQLVFSEIKGNQGWRIVPMAPVVDRLLELQYKRLTKRFGTIADTDFVVCNQKNGLLDPDNLSRYFHQAMIKLGLPPARFHDLRHSFAVRAIEQGMDVLTLSGILGHAHVATTESFYLHPRLSTMHAAMKNIGPSEEIVQEINF